jgi:hypothetical protein
VRVLVLHGVAAALLVGLGWFLIQPVQGDIALWTPAFGSLLFVAAFAIAGGCFAWTRFGSRRALIAGDILALFQMAFVSLLLITLPVTFIAAVLVVFGIRGARSVDESPERSVHRAAKVNPVALLAAITIGVILTIQTYDFVLGDVAPFVDYGVSEVVITGSIWLAILFWLDGRPGALLGASVALLYLGGKQLADVAALAAYPLFIQLEVLLSLGASAILAITTALAVWRRPFRQRVASGAVAGLFVVGVLALAVVAPISLVLALFIDRPAAETEADSAGRVASDEPGIGVLEGA